MLLQKNSVPFEGLYYSTRGKINSRIIHGHCCVTRHINPRLELVPPRKTRRNITEKLLTGTIKQTNKNVTYRPGMLVFAPGIKGPSANMECLADRPHLKRFITCLSQTIKFTNQIVLKKRIKITHP